MLNIDVVRSWANQSGSGIIILFCFWFHAVEGDISFRYFILSLYFKVIGSCIKTYIPGPTIGLGLLDCIFYPLNTNAIKFIIIEFINTTDKVI